MQRNALMVRAAVLPSRRDPSAPVWPRRNACSLKCAFAESDPPKYHFKSREQGGGRDWD